mmetsp:Transcript_6984/g.23188  ORF Transcript_6984/g.23188 Transcript_6984/m.23188 type:complete len:249 (-) Transcript_6984:983-1729(-)
MCMSAARTWFWSAGEEEPAEATSTPATPLPPTLTPPTPPSLRPPPFPRSPRASPPLMPKRSLSANETPLASKLWKSLARPQSIESASAAYSARDGHGSGHCPAHATGERMRRKTVLPASGSRRSTSVSVSSRRVTSGGMAPAAATTGRHSSMYASHPSDATASARNTEPPRFSGSLRTRTRAGTPSAATTAEPVCATPRGSVCSRGDRREPLISPSTPPTPPTSLLLSSRSAARLLATRPPAPRRAWC